MKPLPLEDWDESLQHVIDDMHGRPINIHALLANHPALLNAWWNLRMYLVNGGELEQRQCELVILRIAAHMGSWYEWASHVVRGIDSGLTLEEIERVKSDDGSWSDADAALLEAVDEIATCHAIGAPTLERLAAHFTERQAMDVIHLHGMYQTLGCLINTWGLELDDQVAERLPQRVTERSFSGH
jgi:alkylhydroperoxidase family enzyme